MTRRPGDDRGSVAAELALAVPSVLLVLLLGIAALGAASRQVALQDAAADAARLLGRGEDAVAAASAVSRAVPGAGMASRSADDVVCVTAQSEVGIAAIRVPLRASSCALGRWAVMNVLPDRDGTG